MGYPQPGEREFLFGVCEVKVSEATVCRLIKRLGPNRKKLAGASERDDRPRLVWRSTISVPDAKRLVFVDEMNIHTTLAPLYAYSPPGKGVFYSAEEQG